MVHKYHFVWIVTLIFLQLKKNVIRIFLCKFYPIIKLLNSKGTLSISRHLSTLYSPAPQQIVKQIQNLIIINTLELQLFLFVVKFHIFSKFKMKFKSVSVKMVQKMAFKGRTTLKTFHVWCN